MSEVHPTLLVIDDEPGMLALVERFAHGLGFNVVCHHGGRGALDHIPEARPDVVIVDLQMPEMSGIEVLRAIRQLDPECAVILMTAHASVESAIEAVKLGALDYLTKPLDFERLKDLLTTVRKGIERRERLLTIDADVAKQFEFQAMIGRSSAMQDLFDSIRRLAPHVRTALITGETGTGKELVARAFHKIGPRRDKRFLTVNCSAVVETLFESELFGHQRGAFTGATDTKVGVFEHADGGGLFLDEVGELPLTVQPKLLRAVEHGDVQRVGSLDSKRVDVRVIAATNRDLRAECAAGTVPERPVFPSEHDGNHAASTSRTPRGHPTADGGLRSRVCLASEPAADGCDDGRRAGASRGSVAREHPGAPQRHRARVPAEREPDPERARDSCGDDGRRVSRCGDARRLHRGWSCRVVSPGSEGDEQLLSTAQRAQIDRVLKLSGGNKTEAARMLGISRRSLYRWIDRLALDEAARGSV